jgi:hypothetical protein
MADPTIARIGLAGLQPSQPGKRCATNPARSLHLRPRGRRARNPRPGIPVLSVTIDNAPNMHRGAYKAAHACGLECLTVLCLAGIAAEEMLCGPITDGGDAPDLQMAREYLARAIPNPLRAAAELARCRVAAERLVRSEFARQRIAKLAAALLRQGTLRGEEIFAFC